MSLYMLTQFALALAYCPCCCETEKCLEDCTIEIDSRAIGGSALDKYELMLGARAALSHKD